MLDQHQEYLIAASLDATLSAEERAELDALLASSDDARRLLREYRQLSGLLRLSRETPDVDFAALRQDIARGIYDLSPDSLLDPEETSVAERAGLAGASDFDAGRRQGDSHAPTRRHSYWARTGRAVMLRRGALAASLLLAVGLSWQTYRASRNSMRGLSSPNAQVTGSDTTADRDSAHHPPTLSAPGPNPLQSAFAAAIQSPPMIAVGQPDAAAKLNAITPVSIAIGPAPAIAQEFPSIKMSHNELYPKYGTVKVVPDVQSTAAPMDPPFPY